MQAVVWFDKVIMPKFDAWELCQLNKVNKIKSSENIAFRPVARTFLEV